MTRFSLKGPGRRTEDTAAGGMPQCSLLLVGRSISGDPRLRQSLERHFALVESADTPAHADRLLPRCHFDLIIVDVRSSADPALAWMKKIRTDDSGGQTILATGGQGPDLADICRLAGAAEFLAQPLDAAALIAGLRNAGTAGDQPVEAARRATVRPTGNPSLELIGDSEPICRIRDLVARIAPTPATVLIEGDTGTGKELVARLLHAQSRQRGSFVPVNCGAIPPELMETELFGHAKGAFTGAHQLREGLFVAACGGTLFLDEVSEMRSDLQVKLLRALEEGAIRPVGADREIPVSVRIVASAQPGLLEKVREGQFRQDLYYRLNVIHIGLPGLRDRPEDVPALVAHFMSRVAGDFGLPAVDLGEDDLQRLRERDWRGNVRELRNVVERTVLLGALPLTEPAESNRTEPPVGVYPLDWTLEQVKQAHIERVLESTGGNRSAAARHLGVSRKTLERKLGPASERHATD